MRAREKSKKKKYNVQLAKHNKKTKKSIVISKRTSSSFPTIFPKFRDPNYFLLPYTNIHHNKFS
jgi:hypothetical protein